MANHEEHEKLKTTSLGETIHPESTQPKATLGEAHQQKEELAQKPTPSATPGVTPPSLASSHVLKTSTPEPHPAPPAPTATPTSSVTQAVSPSTHPQERKPRARGTAAMDPQTRREVARKGGLAVSRNKQHMAEIGRKGGQSVSKNREHMAQIGRKGGAASRGHRSTS